MISIQYDDRAALAALNNLSSFTQDLTPAMRDIAASLEDVAAESFKRAQSPDDNPWDDLSEHTKLRRAKVKKWPGQILQVHGLLAGSITSRYDSSSAEAGTNLVYAATHQFGAEQGEFGSTQSGRPIPFDDIPARPFLGRSAALDMGILNVINRHLDNALRRR